VACNIAGKNRQERQQVIQDLFSYWLSKGNIKNRFTHKGLIKDKDAIDTLAWFFEQRLELPFDINSPIRDHHVRRAKVEIDSFDRALGGKFSNLAFIVPEGISKQDPISRKFYTELNRILDFERVNVNSVMTDNAYIADHMLDAYVHEHNTKGIVHGTIMRKKGDKALQELRRLRKDLTESDPSARKEADLIAKIKEFIESDKEGKTLKDFKDLIEMDHATFKKATGPDEYFDKDNQLRAFNPHVVLAVKKAKENLAKMGSTYQLGLTGLQKMIAFVHTGEPNIKNARNSSQEARNLIDIIEASKKDLSDGSKAGGYFPRIEFETMMSIKEGIGNALTTNREGQNRAFSDVITNILSNANISRVPGHAQKRSLVELDKYWDLDPLLVLKEYGDQAVQFNKLIHTQLTYLKALKQLPHTPDKFHRGLRRFIDEEYAVFTRGTSGRTDWANSAVTALNAYQTARTMGLNITGAVKNAASAIHFYSRVGLGSLKETRKAMTDGSFRDMMREVEKETGFLFADAAPELYTEGLISKKDLNSGNITFNPVTGKIEMNNSPIIDKLKAGGKWTLDKGLFFHRLTENYQRKWMFRTAMYKMYTQLIKDGYPEPDAKKFAMAYALNSVNSWAYEYAAHAKSKWARGESRTIEEIDKDTIEGKWAPSVKGGFSEVALHLMHYPMSLAESHYSSLKGAHKALLAKQGFQAEEIQYAARYAAISLGVALVSMLSNTNLFNIFENETQDRLLRAKDDLFAHGDKDKSTFGLLSEISGPTIGHIKYGLIAAGIIDVEDNTLNKIIFGNVDFSDPEDEKSNRYAAYQWSTFWGTTKNKIWPTLQNGRGRDLITHYLKLYPSDWTKAGHEKVFGKTKKAKKSNDDTVLQSLALLKQLSEK